MAYGYKGKGVTNHLLLDTLGNPIAIKTTAANISERDQVIFLLQKVNRFVKPLIWRGYTPILEADKGYDSRAFRISILSRKIFPWVPYRGNRKKKGIQYLEKFRWQVERGISWLQRKFRRLNIRWERKMVYWNGFLNLSLIFFWMQKIGNFLGLCG